MILKKRRFLWKIVQNGFQLVCILNVANGYVKKRQQINIPRLSKLWNKQTTLILMRTRKKVCKKGGTFLGHLCPYLLPHNFPLSVCKKKWKPAKLMKKKKNSCKNYGTFVVAPFFLHFSSTREIFSIYANNNKNIPRNLPEECPSVMLLFQLFQRRKNFP